MANTFTKIASTTVGSTSVSSVEFTSIPNTYTDLIIYFSARLDGAGTGLDSKIVLNNDTSTSANVQKYIIIYTSNNTYNSGSQTYLQTGIAPAAQSSSGVFSNTYVYIPNYTSSSYKALTAHDSTGNFTGTGTNNYLWYSANRWTGTAAITSITISPNGAHNWVQYSSFYLYGIKNS